MGEGQLGWMGGSGRMGSREHWEVEKVAEHHDLRLQRLLQVQELPARGERYDRPEEAAHADA